AKEAEGCQGFAGLQEPGGPFGQVAFADRPVGELRLAFAAEDAEGSDADDADDDGCSEHYSAACRSSSSRSCSAPPSRKYVYSTICSAATVRITSSANQ